MNAGKSSSTLSKGEAIPHAFEGIGKFLNAVVAEHGEADHRLWKTVFPEVPD